MKKYLLMFSVMFTLVATSFAQNAQATDPIEHKQKGKDKMRPRKAHPMESLNLNEQQKQDMKALNNDFHGKMKAVKTDKSLSKEQKMAKMKELNQEHDSRIKKSLSTEQYNQWSEGKKNRMAKMKEKRKNGKGKHHRGEHRGEKPAKGEFKSDDKPAPSKN